MSNFKMHQLTLQNASTNTKRLIDFLGFLKQFLHENIVSVEGMKIIKKSDRDNQFTPLF